MAIQREAITTKNAPEPVGPYSQAIRVGNFIFTAGQVGLSPASGKLVEGGVEAQAQQVMQNLANILEAAGTSLTNVVKTTIFLTNLSDFAAVNKIYGGFFTAAPPARTTVQVAGLPLGALVEIETIAVVDNTQ
jgi:2-iminobutanoate/2-iminopropanoate deaminase